MSALRASLFLTIGKTLDDGREVLRTYSAKLITGEAPGWELEREEDGEILAYVVRIGQKGQVSCTCRDAGYRGRPCKHELALRMLGLLRKPKSNGEE